jgi:hypothetical protein
MPITISNRAPSANDNLLKSCSSIELFFSSETTALDKLPVVGSKGTLNIKQEYLEWLGQNGIYMKIDYPSIGLHAVALRDPLVETRNCLYLQLQAQIVDENGSTIVEQTQDDEELGFELRLVPTNQDLDLYDLFASLSKASAMHQDVEQHTLEEGLAGGNWITSENVDSFQPSAQQQVFLLAADLLVACT